jgi:hypothetical protein
MGNSKSSSTAEECPAFATQVLSDIHLEFDGAVDVGEPTAPFLLLAGDIGVCHDSRFPQLEAFIGNCCEKWRGVFFVAGNHESYNGNLTETNTKLKRLSRGIENFHFLDCDYFDVPSTDVRVLGCTLWSYVTDEGGEMLNDFRVIHDLDVASYRALHHGHVRWLEGQCAAAAVANKRVVVVTHHAPFVAGLVPNVSSGGTLLRNGCLGTDIMDKFGKSRFPHLQAWVYGHTHLSKRCEINGIRVISNQWGYPHDAVRTRAAEKLLPGYTSFDRAFRLEVPQNPRDGDAAAGVVRPDADVDADAAAVVDRAKVPLAGTMVDQQRGSDAGAAQRDVGGYGGH